MARTAHRVVRETRADRIVAVVTYVVLGVFGLILLYPLVYVISASVSSPDAVVSGRMWLWPTDLTLSGYRTVFEDPAIVRGFLNSLFYTVVGTVIQVTLTLLAAYPLSRRDLVGRHVIMLALGFTLLFNGGIIPTYLVVHDLGLLDTRWAMIVPTAMSVLNVFITWAFFRFTIPQELFDAARVDGCDDFRFFGRIVLPLSKPIIAVNALFYAVGQWNSFFNALIYLTDDKLFPLQLILREILVQNTPTQGQLPEATELIRQRQDIFIQLKYVLIVLAAVPTLLAVPFAQKYFVKGIVMGSVKE